MSTVLWVTHSDNNFLHTTLTTWHNIIYNVLCGLYLHVILMYYDKK